MSVPAAGSPPEPGVRRELEQLTTLQEPVGSLPVPGGDRVLLQVDRGGNERHQILLLEGPGREPQPLIEEPDWIHWLGSVRDDGQAFSYQCNRRNGTDFDVYVRDLHTGEDRMVFDMGGWCSPGSFSPDGRWLSIVRYTERNMDSDLYLVDVESGEVVHVNPHAEDASASSPAWLAGGTDFYFATNQDREFLGIARYSLETRTWRYVLEEEWDLGVGLDPLRNRALVSSNEDGFSRLRIFDASSLKHLKELRLPGRGVVGGAEFSPDGTRLAVGFTSADVPGDVWLFDVETGEGARLTSSPNPVGQIAMVTPELVRFDSFDGLSVPAFVFRPRASGGPAPVVVQIHGGPEGQSLPSWNPIVQYLVARGYAVVVPNVRGSTGYGRTYHHLDDVRLRLDSVRDLAALHDWISTDPGLDHNRAALYGGSYGGFMVLAGLTFQPERWAAAVDIVGISSFVTFLENTSPWRRKFREREYGSLENDREFLEEISPLTHIDQLRAPLFIIHGANDPRVPLSEAEQIAKVLEQKGIRHELAVYADEGHGLAKLANRLDAYPRAADFLDEVLGQRK
ncbi:MAG TPA: S9 family peptidase [Acidimicrobiales bacterium]|nr:S9 family peptidase [Acidimicrobiales bacterium]